VHEIHISSEITQSNYGKLIFQHLFHDCLSKFINLKATITSYLNAICPTLNKNAKNEWVFAFNRILDAAAQEPPINVNICSCAPIAGTPPMSRFNECECHCKSHENILFFLNCHFKLINLLIAKFYTSS